MKNFKLLLLVLTVFTSCSLFEEDEIDWGPICTDNECQNIRVYLLRRHARGELEAIQAGYEMDENGYYHFPMNSMSQYGHTTMDYSDDLGRYFTLQAFFDDGYIRDMMPQAPSYSKPDIVGSISSNYWYRVDGALFKSNRYDIFSEYNGQTFIPTGNVDVRTSAYAEDLINVVQGGVRWAFNADRGSQWTFKWMSTLNQRMIGDTISLAIKFKVGGELGDDEIDVIKYLDVVVEP